MEYTDCHTHTLFSNHGIGTVDEVVQAALARGLTTIAITEHLPLPDAVNDRGEFAMDADKVDCYLEAIAAARIAYPQIEVICGTEVDWRCGAQDYILEQLGLAKRAPAALGVPNVLGAPDSSDTRALEVSATPTTAIAEVPQPPNAPTATHAPQPPNAPTATHAPQPLGAAFVRKYPYELILGSVHMLTEADGSHWEFDHPDYLSGWYERGEEFVWQRYFELWRDAVRSIVPFQIMTHPDLPKKLGFKPRFDTRELYQAMALEAARADVMIEVNTSGLHKPVAELYPAPELLRAFCTAGVPCCVNSDAHKPADVGRDLDKGYYAMKKAGYTHVTVPTRTGDRRKIALDL